MALILLVEDNEMNRDMLSRRLQRKNFELVIAVNGQQAIDIANSQNPDIILMDMELPIKDGWSATREIRKNSATPIIALTAHALPGDREKSFAAGCNDYATKPIDFKHLLSLIHKYLDRAQRRDAL